MLHAKIHRNMFTYSMLHYLQQLCNSSFCNTLNNNTNTFATKKNGYWEIFLYLCTKTKNNEKSIFPFNNCDDIHRLSTEQPETRISGN